MVLRQPTLRELVADTIVHGVGIGIGGIGALILIALAATYGKDAALPAVIIYAVGLLAMLGCSAAYHLLRSNRRRELLRRLDHAAIFLMIAGTYTPFTTLYLSGAWSIGLTACVWGVAAAGIAAQLSTSSTFDRVSIATYLALGWAGLIALGPLIASMPTSVLVLLAIGGLIYSAGVIFHVWESLAFQNAVWHAFVLVAAAVHYSAVLESVMLARDG